MQLRSSITSLALAATLCVACVVAPASDAHARSETLRWLNGDPDPQRIDGFRFHFGTVSRSYDTTVDVGLPAPDGGVYTYDLDVPDGVTVYIAMTSYDGPTESVLSNELVRTGGAASPNQAPDGSIDLPVGSVTITEGQSVSFAGSGSDPDGNTPLTYAWDFGVSGVSPTSLEDPGSVSFDVAGTFTVSLVVTDDRGLADPTPASVLITVDPPPPPDPGSDAEPDPDAGLDVVFVDMTVPAGVDYLQYQVTEPPLASDAEYMTGGVAVGDYDGDGWDDLYVTSLDARDTLFRNRGDGTFEDVTEVAGLDLDLASNGAAFGDLDNDGDQDLYVTTLGPDQSRFYLFINDGSGRFRDEALARGAAVEGSDPHYGFGVTFGDYDLDGWLDIHTTEWRDDADNLQGARPNSRLLRNLGAASPGHFEDVTDPAGVQLDTDPAVPANTALSSHFADMDYDGWPDLLVVADGGASRLFWNLGDGTFSDGTDAAGVGTEESGTGSAVADYDGDGRQDWFVTSVYDPADADLSGNRLYLNDGGRSFTDRTDVSGVRDGYWGTAALFFDLDNDADLDLAMTNGVNLPFLSSPDDVPFARFDPDPMRAWRNEGSRGMIESSATLGLTHEAPGRGIAVFDYDHDGDLDLFVVNNATGPVLYHNLGGDQNDWLRVEPRGKDSNRDGIGAIVAVWVDAAELPQVREIGSGNTFLGQSERTAHFGVGSSQDPIDRVVVHWPATGRTVEFTEVERNTTLLVSEPVEAASAGAEPSDGGGGGSGGGSCGLLGIEVLPVLAMSAWRRRRR